MRRVNCKKLSVSAGLFFLILLFSLSAHAHPGRTDAYGGHTDSSTGQYHYHHGHEAHQHPNGICPYGDYEEWLAAHGTNATYDPSDLIYTNEAGVQDSSNAWEGIGIGVGGAAAASAIGYGVYRKTRKKKEAATKQTNTPPYEYAPNTIVYIANNGSRYHLRCGCCNAIQSMELGEALKEGRVPCPDCCNEAMVEYSVQTLEEEQNALLPETDQSEQSVAQVNDVFTYTEQTAMEQISQDKTEE